MLKIVHIKPLKIELDLVKGLVSKKQLALQLMEVLKLIKINVFNVELVFIHVLLVLLLMNLILKMLFLY